MCNDCWYHVVLRALYGEEGVLGPTGGPMGPLPDWMLAWLRSELDRPEIPTVEDILLLINALHTKGYNQQALDLGVALLEHAEAVQLDAHPLARANLQLQLAQASLSNGDVAAAKRQIRAFPSRNRLKMEMEQLGGE